MEKTERDAGSLLAGQVEALLRRGGFRIKKNAVFKVNDRAEVAPFVAVSPSGTEIILDCDEVNTETNQFVKPILEKLLEKRMRLGVEKVLLITTPKLATKPGFDHVIGLMTYASQGVYYWDSYELKRLSSMNDAELKAELVKNLKLVFMKDPDGVFRAGEGKDVSVKDPDSLSSTVKDVLSAAPPISPRYQSGAATEAEAGEQHHSDFFSDNMVIILVASAVVLFLVLLLFFWKTIEEFLSGISNVLGLIVLILIVILLSIYSTD